MSTMCVRVIVYLLDTLIYDTACFLFSIIGVGYAKSRDLIPTLVYGSRADQTHISSSQLACWILDNLLHLRHLVHALPHDLLFPN